MKTIVAFDLGANLGWSMIDASGFVTSGVCKLSHGKQKKEGEKFIRMGIFLERVLAGTIPDIIVYEQVMRHIGTKAAHAYGGYLAILQMYCASNNIPCIGVGIKTIKKYISGNGAAKKKDVINAVNALGKNVTDDNEADALALLYYSIKNVSLTP